MAQDHYDTICMVNGISDHSPSPKVIATARGLALATMAAVLTSASARTKSERVGEPTLHPRGCGKRGRLEHTALLDALRVRGY